jgi:hypothetical protein
MDRSKKSTDWEVLGVSAVAGGAGPGGGEFIFHFRREGGAVAVMSCTVYGLALGGLGGSVLGTYSRITPECAFSINDLDGCAGRLTTAGAGLGAGYGLVYISAFGLHVGNLFLSQSVGGFTITAGAGALTGMAYWKCVGDY